jgi:hypothetical protein
VDSNLRLRTTTALHSPRCLTSPRSQYRRRRADSSIHPSVAGVSRKMKPLTLVRTQPLRRIATHGLLLRTQEAQRAPLPAPSNPLSVRATGRTHGKRNSHHPHQRLSRPIHEPPTTSLVSVTTSSMSPRQNHAVKRLQQRETQPSQPRIQSHRLSPNSRVSPSKLLCVKVRTDIMACLPLHLLWIHVVCPWVQFPRRLRTRQSAILHRQPTTSHLSVASVHHSLHTPAETCERPQNVMLHRNKTCSLRAESRGQLHVLDKDSRRAELQLPMRAPLLQSQHHFAAPALDLLSLVTHASLTAELHLTRTKQLQVVRARIPPVQ